MMTTAFRAAVAMFAGLGALLLAAAAANAADYQVYKDVRCTTFTECGINFDAVPSGKTLRIDNVSCYLRHLDTYDVGAAQLVVVRADGSRAFAITVTLRNQSRVNLGGSTYYVYVSNDTIRAVAQAGQRFRAYAQVYQSESGTLGKVAQLACGISGTLN